MQVLTIGSVLYKIKMVMEMSKAKNVISLIINTVIFVSTALVVVSIFLWRSDPLIKHPYETFKFFTTDSNILCAISAIIVIIFDIRIITGKSKEIPRWAAVLKYIGTTSVMVTFTTVMLFLGPLYTYYFVLKGTAFYMHLVGPLLALVSFWLFEPYGIIRKREIHLAVLPMAVYGAVYLTEVLIIGEFDGWQDFYGFNTGGMWYLSITLMLTGTYLLAIVIRLLHNHAAKRAMAKFEIFSKRT